jgi:cytochrome c
MKRKFYDGLIWDKENLNKFLEDPCVRLSGHSLTFVGLKKERDRQDVLRFLWEQHPKRRKKK